MDMALSVVLCIFYLFLLLLHFPSYTTSSSSLPHCNPDQSFALLLFKNSFSVDISASGSCDYPSNKTTSWENGTNCCQWDGVTCDSMSGHVIGLDLSCSNLRGQLHPNTTLFHLTHLLHLNLSSNSLFGDIPSKISHLSKLVSLDLSNQWLKLDAFTWNKFILNATNLQELVLRGGVQMSSIKEDSLSLLMNLSSLVSLHLYGLSGNFPSGVLCLPKIQELDLSWSPGLRGELPKSNWSVPLRLLDLFYTTFSGEIPNSIGHLKSLQVLRLGRCEFKGLVPPSLGNLTQLTDLDLSENHLTGEIPSSLSNLNLQFLSLQTNNISGRIPDMFNNFTLLQKIRLSNNNLEGQLPSSLFVLTQLTHLDLSANNLKGEISSSVSNLKHLDYMNLGSNNLSGHIPDVFDNLTRLYFLSLSLNNLEGQLPSSLFNLTDLTYLYLYSNQLEGPISNKITKLSKLEYLDLSQNLLNGIIPPWCYSLSSLKSLVLRDNKLTRSLKEFSNSSLSYLSLSNNSFEGSLPILPYGIVYFSISNNNLTGDISSAVSNASSLQLLDLAHNNLTGTIPRCLGTFDYLVVLDLQMNNIYGSIPDNFSKINSFETIKLNGNLVEGPLPQSLAHCIWLEVLDLGDNYIQDIFSSWLETLPNLRVLILRENKFHGSITSFNTKLPFFRLRIFDVSHNHFSGPLPTSYFRKLQAMMNVNENQSGLKYIETMDGVYNDSIVVDMKGLSFELVRILNTFTTIDLSSNMFEGEIPHEIGELDSLRGLNLSHNAITGTIPQSLGNLKSLEWLDLSWNQLRGEIPMTLTNLNFLSVLNLSQNHFEGLIPTGKQFNTFQNDSYGGNPMLCGTPLSKSCNHGEEQPPSTFYHEERFGFGWKPVAVGYACGVVFGLLLGYCFFLSGRYSKNKCKKNKQ